MREDESDQSSSLAPQHQALEEDDDDDDDDWVPLQVVDPCSSISSHSAVVSSTNEGDMTFSSLNGSGRASSSRSPDRDSQRGRKLAVAARPSSLRTSRGSTTIRRKTSDHNKRLKEGLVDHPMQIFQSRILQHFGRELWELDLKIRFSLLLMGTGAIIKLFVLSTWYLFYPKLFLGTFLSLLLPAVYLYRQQNSLLLEFLELPKDLSDAVARFESAHLRQIAVFVLYILPFLLELRTIHFLAEIQTDGWVPVSFYGWMIGVILLGSMTYAWRGQNSSPRDCTYKGLLVLYGSALLVTLARLDVYRVPVLAGPFLMATGVLLLQEHGDDEWISRVVRNSLKLTLRDTLQEMGNSVQQDEMLQLAMLRWIVDYWAKSPSSDHGASPYEARARTSNQSHSTSNPASSPTSDVQWPELYSMLNFTTDQMASEVHTLQQQQQSAPVASNAEGAVAIPSRDAGGPGTSEQLAAGSHPSYRNSGSTPAASPDSVQSLQSMLASMNLDDQAKPAVMAYKRGVESFPPSKRAAMLLSVARRCPASILLIWQVAGTVLFGRPVPFLVILLPFVFFEFLRVQQWEQSCQWASRCISSTTRDQSDTRKVDSMILLLMGESNHCPTLLLVWYNVVGSVSALEVGLTAARCVQTTAVAVEFVGNITSLTNFGLEVHQNGWVHGLSVLFREFLLIHTQERGSGGWERNVPPSATYTKAAVSAFRNSQKMDKNVRILMEEEDVGKVLRPLMEFLPVLVGQGWLWGRPESEHDEARSKVEIEILDEENDAAVGVAASVTTDIHRGNVALLEASKEARGTGPRAAQTEIHSSTVPEISQEESEPEDTSKESRDLPIISNCFMTEQEAKLPVTSAKELQGSAAAHEPNSSFIETRSELMDLLAECDELGLVEQAEKNRIIELVAAADAEQIQGTARTLHGLLNLHREKAEDSCLITAGAPSEQKALKGDQVPPSKSVQKPESIHDGAESFEPLDIQVDSVRETNNPEKSQSLTSSPLRMAVEADDDDEFEPLDEGDRIEEVSDFPFVAERRTEPSKQTEDSLLDESNAVAAGGDDENIWLKVGGGLALLGAVVGGVALAAANHGDDEGNSNSSRRRRNRPLSVEDRASG